MRRCLALVLVLGLGLPMHSVRAEDAREACVAALDDASVARWSSRVDAELSRAQHRTRGWFFSWIAINASFVIGASIYAAALRDNHLQRDAGIWGAAGSGTTLLLLFAPPPSMAFAERRIARLPEAERSDPRRRMLHSLASFDRGARQEPTMRAWPLHVVNSSYSVAEGLYLGLRYDDSLATALGNFFLTLVIGETQLFTAPRASAKGLARLRAEGMPCAERTTSVAPAAPRAIVTPLVGGVRVDF